MSVRRLLLMLLPVLAFSLACGGLWREIQEEDLAELAVQVEQAAPGPERDATLAVIQRAFVAVRSGQVGTWGLIGFEVEVEDALEDGAITAAELTAIRRKAPKLPPADPTRLAALQAEFELLVVDARGGPPPAPPLDPAAFETAIAGQGWSEGGCATVSEAAPPEVWCEYVRDGDVLTVDALVLATAGEAAADAEQNPQAETRIDGSRILLAWVADQGLSRELRDVLLPPGQRIADVGYQELAERGAAAGWIPVGSPMQARETDHEALALERGERWALVEIARVGEGAGAEERAAESGSAWVAQGDHRLTVTAHDGQRAASILTALP